jgi:membrane-bound lytic murein transglycosylase B
MVDLVRLRPLLLPLVAALVLAGVLAPTTAGSQTQPPAVTPPTTPGPAPVTQMGDERLAPELVNVPIDSSQHAALQAAYATAQNNLRIAEQAVERADRTLTELTAAEQRLDVQLRAAQLRRDVAAQQIEVTREGLRELAVEAYVLGGEDQTSRAVGHDAVDAALEHGSDWALIDAASAHHRDEYLTNVHIRDAANREIERTTTLLASARDRYAETTLARAAAVTTVDELVIEVEERRLGVIDSRFTGMVVGLDFPLVALDAFWKASVKLNSEADCGLRWEMLAGISRVEGVHGTYGGSQLDGRGNTTIRITGPPLDGRPGFATVMDSDGGYYDDDPVFDRGVGPMGFLPTSWQGYGSDGNGDLVADPHNIYDAAEASARLLCRTSRRLDIESNLRTALFNYNRSQRYVNIVHGYITNYDAVPLDLPTDPRLQPPPIPTDEPETTTTTGVPPPPFGAATD